MKTSIGYLPAPADIDTNGLAIDSADLDALLSLDTDGWKAAVPQIREHYAQFGDKLPSKLAASLTELESALA